MKNKIIGVCPEVYVGVCQVFRHTQKLGYIDFKYLELDLDLKSYDILILGAYHPSYEELLNISNIKKYFLITSSTTQIEQSSEIPYINRIITLLKDKKVDGILIGDKDLYHCFSNENIHYFPYPFHDGLLPMRGKQKINGAIGLFAPTHHRKNIFAQMMAVRIMNYKNPEIKLYTNSKIVLPGNIEYLNWIKEPKEYYCLLSRMRLILNCFISESFCYSTLDSIIMGTIPIISHCVRDNLDLPKRLVVDNINSPIAISKKMEELLLLSKEEYVQLIKEVQGGVAELIQKQNSKLKELLDSL